MINNILGKYKWTLCGVNYLLASKDGKKTSSYNNIFVIYSVYIRSLFRLIFYFVEQFFIKIDDNYIVKDHIVLEVDKSYRHKNLYRLGLSESKITKIKVFNRADTMKFQRVGVGELLRQFVITLSEFNYMISSHQKYEIKINIIRNAPLFIPIYTYLFCFFKKIKRANPKCVAYTGGGISIATNACISAGISSTYLAHGSIEKVYYAAFPNFSSVYVYSDEEKKYLESTQISANIYVYPYDYLNKHNKLVILFLNIELANDYTALTKLVNFFKFFKYHVYVKRHPVDNYNTDLKDWIRNLNLQVIDNKKYWDASSIIKHLKPSYTIGSLSTSLCESLKMGVIPINIPSVPADYYEFWRDALVYPTEKRALSWTSEKDIIRSIISEEVLYSDILELLKNR